MYMLIFAFWNFYHFIINLNFISNIGTVCTRKPKYRLSGTPIFFSSLRNEKTQFFLRKTPGTLLITSKNYNVYEIIKIVPIARMFYLLPSNNGCR
jgi:hypothetical protein